MTVKEIGDARQEFQDKCTGISPLNANIGATIDFLIMKGLVIREVVGVFDNGIRVVCFRDKQNRYIGSNYETA